LKRMRSVRPREIAIAARQWAKYQGEFRHLAAGSWSVPTFVWLAKRWLRFHGKLVLPSRRVVFTDKLRTYAEFMESERGLSPVTIRGRIGQTTRFLRWCSQDLKLRRLPAISLNDVDKYFSANADRWNMVSVSSSASALRAFFTYAESRRWCRAGIAYGIKSPAVRAGSFTSDGPKWHDVLRLVCSRWRTHEGEQ
jgi:hypothetical protein